MAAARQKEMNVNITEVATKTLTAGRCRFSAVVDMMVPGLPGAPHRRLVAKKAASDECTRFPGGLSAERVRR